MFRAELKKEGYILWRSKQEIVHVLAFYALFLYLLRMFMSLEQAQSMASAVLWLGLAFSLLLSAEKCFDQECQAGILEDYSLRSVLNIHAFILSKLILRFVAIVLPLLGLSILGGFALGEKPCVLMHTVLTEAFIAPAFLVFTALGSVATLVLRRTALLMGFIVLPLQMPLLILGNTVSHAAAFSEPLAPLYAMVAAFVLLIVTVVPFLIAVLVKAGVV